MRKKLRSGWRNDDDVLNQYFQSCYTNWKVYKGERTAKQVLKLQAIYKQAVYGDNSADPPEHLDSAAGLKWQAWQRLLGMSTQMAKRRFITFLAEINPILIDVMPDEKPPLGFPLDRKGIPICAKCNTSVGCMRPLLDQNKMSLKQQLYDHEELHEPERFKEWVRNALEHQRCIWGVHKPISKAEAKQFLAWFNKDENKGFYPYDSVSVMLLVKELVHHHHEIAYDMMQQRKNSENNNSNEVVDAVDYNAQSVKASKLKSVFEELSGEEFVFLVPCDRMDNELCNQRRNADNGRNHTHTTTIDPPTAANANTMEEAVALRKQCQKLGLQACTGVVVDMAQRCDIYRARLATYYEALKKANISKQRNDERAAMHALDKSKVKQRAKEMLKKQLCEACHENHIEKILKVIRRGGEINEETARGLTPLICLVINDVPVEKVESLIALHVQMDAINQYGMNALMMSCRLNNTAMVHVLMRSGASAMQKVTNALLYYFYNVSTLFIFHIILYNNL